MASLEIVFKINDLSVQGVDLVFFLMEYSCVIQESRTLIINACIVNFFLHQAVYFLFQKLKSLFIMELAISR